jgi:hypothetical protein
MTSMVNMNWSLLSQFFLSTGKKINYFKILFYHSILDSNLRTNKHRDLKLKVISIDRGATIFELSRHRLALSSPYLAKRVTEEIRFQA